jgi:hypothetical protein
VTLPLKEVVMTDPTRTRVPRFCPKCGEPDPPATDEVMWCRRCGWAEEREATTRDATSNEN